MPAARGQECFYYHECSAFQQFVVAGKVVFQAECVSDWKHRCCILNPTSVANMLRLRT